MNTIQPSDLVLKEFYITNSTVHSIFPESNKRVRLDRLKVSADFDIFYSEEDGDNFHFLVNFNIRCNEEEKPGYFIDVGTVGKFSLKNHNGISDKVENQYVLYTALPMVINQTRMFIQTITSMHSLGTYLFPALDLSELIKSKIDKDDQNEIK